MRIAMRMKMLAKMMSPGDQERKLCPSIRIPVSLWQTPIPLASLDLFDLKMNIYSQHLIFDHTNRL